MGVRLLSASPLCADAGSRAPSRLSNTSIHAYSILSSGDNREIYAITPNEYYMAEGVQPEQKRDIIDFYTRTDEPERTRAERPTADIYIYIYIVMCSSTIIEHKNESVAKQLCMLFPIRVSSVD